MALKSFIKNLFKKPDIGPSVHQIDAEVEAAVRSIAAGAKSDVHAERVLETGWGEPGDMVYIMALAPIYEILGSRVGRKATNLRDTCKDVFNKYVRHGMGQTSFVGDNFFMRFYTLGESEGFHRAAIITNEVGTNILGERFEKLDVPDLVIAAETQDVTNDDGSLNIKKSDAVIATGGAAVDKTPKDRLKSVQVAFFPTWSPAHEMIEAYACYARRNSSKGLLIGNAVYPELPSDPLSILIDGKKSKLAVRDMTTLAHFKWPVKLFLPLRFATLRSRHTKGIAKILNEILPAWRQKHLIIEILDVPKNATAEHLTPLVQWAKVNGHGAAIRAHFASPLIDRMVASGVEYACFDYEDIKGEKLDFKEYVSQIHDVGIQAVLWNVNETDVLADLIDAQFNLINGTAIAEPTGAVDNCRELGRNQILFDH